MEILSSELRVPNAWDPPTEKAPEVPEFECPPDRFENSNSDDWWHIEGGFVDPHVELTNPWWMLEGYGQPMPHAEQRLSLNWSIAKPKYGTPITFAQINKAMDALTRESLNAIWKDIDKSVWGRL